MLGLIILGLVGGVCSGLFGIGGGSIYIPGIVLLLHLSQQAAQGISLAVMIPTALLGGMVYVKYNLYERKIILPLITGGLLGALIGALIANHIHTDILSKIFAVFLLVGGIKMIKG